MISTILRTAVTYLCVIVAIRVMGKRQISDMQPTELVITILISEIAAIPLQDASQPLLLGIVAIFSLAVLEIVFSVLSMKSQTVRRALSGKTAIIIADGKIDQKAMEKVRMTVPDLLEQLRSKDVFDITHVAFAVLEVNGELNVLLKDEYNPAEKRDVTEKYEKPTLSLAVICDGKIINDSVNALGLTREKILHILSAQKLNLENVFIMTSDGHGNNTVILREERL